VKEQDGDRILQEIRQAVLDQTYVVTAHALLKMRADHLDPVDVESAILTGTIERVFDDDLRGRRYEIIGLACDLDTQVAVIVRFSGRVLIVTVYQVAP